MTPIYENVYVHMKRVRFSNLHSHKLYANRERIFVPYDFSTFSISRFRSLSIYLCIS